MANSSVDSIVDSQSLNNLQTFSLAEKDEIFPDLDLPRLLEIPDVPEIPKRYRGSFQNEIEPDLFAKYGATEPVVNPLWRPSEWQLSLSTHVLSSDSMAGFYNDGVRVDGLSSNGDGTYNMGVGGFSSAKGDAPITFEAAFVRKRATGDHPGEYHTQGPSLYSTLSYQNNQFSDFSWNAELSSQQLSDIVGSTATDVTGQLDANIPDPSSASDVSDIAEYEQELKDWADSNEAGLNNIPGILSHMFDDYDPSKDYSTNSAWSEGYGVPTFRVDEQMCLEDTVTRYDKRINLFHGGRACLEGSALYFGGEHFKENFYLGIGPYVEWTLLSYHQKPFRSFNENSNQKSGDASKNSFVPPSLTVSSFLYGDLQYFNGFSFAEGMDSNNRFMSARLGVGLRTTVPSFSRRYQSK